MPDASHGPAPRILDVAIVGGGLAGLYAIHRLRGLGLTRVGKAVILKDSAAVRGMLHAVAHLVAVEE